MSHSAVLGQFVLGNAVLGSPNVSSVGTTVVPTTLVLSVIYPLPTVGPRISKSFTPLTLASTLSFGIPSVTGGAVTLQIWIGGVNITKYVQQGTCTLTSSLKGRWTASFNCWDLTGTGIGISLPSDPTRGTGQSVVITEGGFRVFMGCLNEWNSIRQTSKDFALITINCLDKSGICDHRIVPTTTYAAGVDIATVVRAIWAGSLNGEGISLFGVPASLGPLENTTIFDFATVTQAFNTLATAALATWWIDVYGRLFFVSIANLPDAPFALSETSDNWREMKPSATLTNYRNTQYVKSNLSNSPSSVPSNIETITLPQPKAVALGFRLGAIVLKFKADQIISLKVNGVAQTVRNGYDVGLNFDKSWWAILPSSFLYGPDASLPTPVPPLGFPYYPITSPFPAIGDVIEVTYIPSVSNTQVQSASALTPSLPGLLKCGSGVYEAVEQVKNVNHAEDMLAIAQAILARSGQVPLNITFKTFTPGLEVGQILHANIPKSQIPAGSKFVISQISATHIGNTIDASGNRGLGHGSGFVWVVSGTSGADQLNAIQIFEKLVARTENALPLLQFEAETFVLAPGGSVSSGVVATNPTIARQSGKLYEIVVQCGVPPVDQTLIINIINSSTGALLTAAQAIKIPSGDGTVHIQSIFVNDPSPTYILVNQGLTVSVSYTITGANPTRAGSITVLVRWAV